MPQVSDECITVWVNFNGETLGMGFPKGMINTVDIERVTEHLTKETRRVNMLRKSGRQYQLYSRRTIRMEM